MRPDPESELEQAIDRELRQLPLHRAPVDLVARVLQAIAEQESRPWWQKAVAYWPWPARLLFLVVTTALAGVLVYFTWGLSTGVSLEFLTDEVAEFTGRFDAVRSICGSLGGAVVTVVQYGGPWLIWSAAGVVVASYFTTLMLGTYCYRLVTQRP